LALAAEGARVAVAARRRQRLNDLVERIRQRGCQALTIEADVTDEAQALARVQRVLQDGA
jgi:NADP-dependent 3-hydroxy acid dehydrogenase YdfG